MSQLQVTTLEANNLSANVITAGQTTVNSTGLYLGKTDTEYSTSVGTTSLVVADTDLNYTTSAEFNNSSDSYTAQNATITNFDTYIRLTGTAIDPILRSPTFSYYGTQIGKIVIKIRRIAGSGWDGSVYYVTSGHSESGSFRMIATQPVWVGTDWAYIQLDGSKLAFGGNDFINNTITQMRFDFGTTASDIFEIDYIRFYPINVLTSIVSAPSITIGGTTYTSLISETVNTQIFTANGTWTKPGWAEGAGGNALVIVHMWGGGGAAGYRQGVAIGGGGGGAFVFGYFKSSQCNATCNVVVGSGGTEQANTVSGGNGENSIFYANTINSLIAYGGAGGFANTTTAAGGAGGGWLSVGTSSGSTANGGAPLGGTISATESTRTSTFGGGAGSNTTTITAGSSVYGGGGGGTNSGNGGISIYGGGGGAWLGVSGYSIYGGRGGNSSVAPGIPGGGGGSSPYIAGARGEVRVYTYRILA